MVDGECTSRFIIEDEGGQATVTGGERRPTNRSRLTGPRGADSVQALMPKRMSRTEWQRFLGGRRVAVLATIGDNGEPVLTPKVGRLWLRAKRLLPPWL